MVEHGPVSDVDCAACQHGWPCVVALQQRVATIEAALARAEGLLRRVVDAPIPGDEFGQHCLYCDWFHESYDQLPVHNGGCVIAEARVLLATRAGADAGEE